MSGWFLSGALSVFLSPALAGSSCEEDCEGDACLYDADDPTLAYTTSIHTLTYDALEQPGRQISVQVSMPQGACGKMPVVILSHGGANGLINPANAMEVWPPILASRGYVTVQIAHTPRPEPQLQALCTALNWDPALPCVLGPAWDRPQDITTTVDFLASQAAGPWSNQIDMHRVGLLGHSAGAMASLQIAGGTRQIGDRVREQHDTRIQSVVALSAPGIGNPGITERSFERIEIPILVVSGAGDRVNPSEPEGLHAEAYDMMDGEDQFVLYFDTQAVRHSTVNLQTTQCAQFASVETCEAYISWISNTVLGFFDATLRDDRYAWDWLRSGNIRRMDEAIVRFEGR